jgi:hypothetical protein
MVCNVVCLPSVGASGGILIVASEQFFKVQQTHQTLNTVFASITMLAENKVWSITRVYEPQAESDKTLFLQEIKDLRQHVLPAWLLLGDFNLIYRAQDKNNSRINLSMLNNFKSTIDNLELAPIDLQGKKIHLV